MSGGVILEKLEDLGRLLSSVKTVAIVGLSEDPGRDSHSIAVYLQGSGFRILGVNPSYSTILGEPCYPALSDIPEDVRDQVDLVLVFRRPEAVPPIMEEAARLGLRRVWLQIGVSSPSAVDAAVRCGIELVANKCIRVVHGLLRGSSQRPGPPPTEGA